MVACSWPEGAPLVAPPRLTSDPRVDVHYAPSRYTITEATKSDFVTPRVRRKTVCGPLPDYMTHAGASVINRVGSSRR